MSESSTNAPIIIKRKKAVVEGGHHGGAWKVAYADFVTAMMAFFLLMWLLNATTEKQRKGIADYFNPSIPLSRISGGGNGMFKGDSVFSTRDLTRDGTGGERRLSSPAKQSGRESRARKKGRNRAENAALKAIESRLKGNSGESDVANRLLRHIRTRVTDEGLIIELFDLPDAPLFQRGSASPTRLLEELVRMISDVIRSTGNKIAIGGFTRSYPIVLKKNPSWDLSAQRAQELRRMMAGAGTNPTRFRRVTGWADRKPANPNLMSVRNNRVEIILLRQLSSG